MNKGVHSRGYLPHWDFANSLQGITFRLADSVPVSVIKAWKKELESIEDDELRISELNRKIAKYEDAGHGKLLLGIPECAEIVQAKLIQNHLVSYKLLEWCVMPNHVHVMIRLLPDHSLSDIVHKWKGGSSYEINRFLERSGTLWAIDYFDRAIRDEEHYYSGRRYIRRNPLKAGLCEEPEDWIFSSANEGTRTLVRSNDDKPAD
jgi:REP element-mobilizing transposase RayT